jgi:hypothetical protein
MDLAHSARWKVSWQVFPLYQTCHRRFQQWVKTGLLDCILQLLYEDLIERGKVNLAQWFIDGSFVHAKGEALLSLAVPA